MWSIFFEAKNCRSLLLPELELYAKPNLTEREEGIIDISVENCFVIDLSPSIKQIVKKMRKTNKIR